MRRASSSPLRQKYNCRTIAGMALSFLTPLQSVFVEHHLNTGEHALADVHACVKGGLRVRLPHGIEAFMPHRLTAMQPMVKLDSLVGTQMKVRVIKAHARPADVIVSHRSVEELELGERRAKRWKALRVGDIVQGILINANPKHKGAIVDLGDSLQAMVPVREMGWTGDARKDWYLTPVGTAWTVKIIGKDEARGRFTASRKTEDPWETLNPANLVGISTHGRVSNVVDFGVFVAVPILGVEGLVHKNQLPANREEWPKPDTKLRVVVEEVRALEQRLSLSLL